MLLQGLLFAFFHSCLRIYRLNWVYLLNQNAPQQSGSSSHKNHNVFFFFFHYPHEIEKNLLDQTVYAYIHIPITTIYRRLLIIPPPLYVVLEPLVPSDWNDNLPVSPEQQKEKKWRKKMELKESDSYNMSKPIPRSRQVGVKPIYVILYCVFNI